MSGSLWTKRISKTDLTSIFNVISEFYLRTNLDTVSRVVDRIVRLWKIAMFRIILAVRISTYVSSLTYTTSVIYRLIRRDPGTAVQELN